MLGVYILSSETVLIFIRIVTYVSGCLSFHYFTVLIVIGSATRFSYIQNLYVHIIFFCFFEMVPCSPSWPQITQAEDDLEFKITSTSQELRLLACATTCGLKFIFLTLHNLHVFLFSKKESVLLGSGGAFL